jgi:hypothetical protein
MRAGSIADPSHRPPAPGNRNWGWPSLLALLLFSLGSLVQVPSAHSWDALTARVQRPEPQAATPQPVIKVHGDRLSVWARNAPWEVVLQELERHTGVSIRAEGTLAGTLTQEFEVLPLEQGLRRIFREANQVFFYAPVAHEGAPPGKLTEIWLLPKEGSAAEGRPLPPSASEAATTERGQKANAMGTAAETIPPHRETTPESKLAVEEEPSERFKALEALATDGDTEALHRALLHSDQDIQGRALELLAERDRSQAVAALVGITKSKEPGTRLQALSRLHEIGQSLDETDQVDQGTVLSTLSAAAADEDTSIKIYAIEALAGWGKPDAMVYLRQAFRDPDPSVRTIVIENVAIQGQDVQLLEEALSDADEMVRSRATFWLKQMDLEGR